MLNGKDEPFNTLNHYNIPQYNLHKIQYLKIIKDKNYMKIINHLAAIIIDKIVAINPNITDKCHYITVYKVNHVIYCKSSANPKQSIRIQSSFDNYYCDLDLAKKIVIRAHNKARHLYTKSKVEIVTNKEHIIGKVTIEPV
jgi:hypothetical protein